MTTLTRVGDFSLHSQDHAILLDVARGYSNIQIAQRLNTPIQTVKNHLSRLYHATATFGRTDLVVWCLRHGAITLDAIYAAPFCPPETHMRRRVG